MGGMAWGRPGNESGGERQKSQAEETFGNADPEKTSAQGLMAGLPLPSAFQSTRPARPTPPSNASSPGYVPGHLKPGRD